MGSRPRNSNGRPAASLQSHKTKRAPKRPKQSAQVRQTSLIDVCDALATICATVDVAASALAKDENEALSVNAAQVLLEHVYEPLSEQTATIEAHAKYRQVEPLLCPNRRGKPGTNSFRKGKLHQHNRWKERRKPLNPRNRL